MQSVSCLLLLCQSALVAAVQVLASTLLTVLRAVVLFWKRLVVDFIFYIHSQCCCSFSLVKSCLTWRIFNLGVPCACLAVCSRKIVIRAVKYRSATFKLCLDAHETVLSN